MYDYVLFVWCSKTKTYARFQRYDSMNALFQDLSELVDSLHVNKFKIFKWKKNTFRQQDYEEFKRVAQ